jgi:hypothetical protein
LTNFFSPHPSNNKDLKSGGWHVPENAIYTSEGGRFYFMWHSFIFLSGTQRVENILFCFIFCITGDWFQNLLVARPVLYHWAERLLKLYFLIKTFNPSASVSLLRGLQVWITTQFISFSIDWRLQCKFFLPLSEISWT